MKISKVSFGFRYDLRIAADGGRMSFAVNAQEDHPVLLAAEIIRRFAVPFPSLGDGKVSAHAETLIALAQAGSAVDTAALEGDLARWSCDGEWPGRLTASSAELRGGRWEPLAGGTVTLAPYVGDRVLHLAGCPASAGFAIEADYSRRPSQSAASELLRFTEELMAAADSVALGSDGWDVFTFKGGHEIRIKMEVAGMAASVEGTAK